MSILNHKYTGILGFVVILAFAFLISNNRKAINYRLVISGLIMQFLLAVFILRTHIGQVLVQKTGDIVAQVLQFSDAGASFAFGPLVKNPDILVKLFGSGADYIFAFRLVPTIIFVSSLVSILYYLGIMQRIIQIFARVVAVVMGASGSEALSNVASVFVGQVEAQLLIRPYIGTMTISELLASMSGSLACAAGSVLAVYIGFGAKASYLLTASVMAAPAALVVSKIVCPETEESKTKGKIQIEVKTNNVNLIDAAAHGAADGLRIGLTVVGMVIAFIALITMTDAIIGAIGKEFYALGARLDMLGLDLSSLKLKDIFGCLFAPIAWLLGVPTGDARLVGQLLGEKLVVNEFVAFADMGSVLRGLTPGHLSIQAETITTVAICGFANFASVAMQIGGIGEIAPSRRHDLARLGLKALLCGTMASYLSAALAGLLV